MKKIFSGLTVAVFASLLLVSVSSDTVANNHTIEPKNNFSVAYDAGPGPHEVMLLAYDTGPGPESIDLPKA